MCKIPPIHIPGNCPTPAMRDPTPAEEERVVKALEAAHEPAPHYCYSYDEERYHGEHATALEALAEAFYGTTERSAVWVGTAAKPSLEQLLPDGDDIAQFVLERMAENASEFYEDAEWPDDDREDETKLAVQLEAVVKAWAAEHVGPPTFFVVDDAKRYTREDYEALLATAARKEA